MEPSAPAIAATGKRRRKGAGPAEVEREHRAERRRLRRPEHGRVGEGIAQETLQGGAGQAERAADAERQQRAGQTDLPHDQASAAAIGERAPPAPFPARSGPGRP
jgi:hypothetical protein